MNEKSTVGSNNPWVVVCRNCNQPTASTAFYCIHDSTLLAFAPRKPITWTLILSPLGLNLLVSASGSYVPIYFALSLGILLYLAVAFREWLPGQPAILGLALLAFILVGASGYPIVLNLGSILYFGIFLALLGFRTIAQISIRSHGLSIAISASLAVLTFYSLLLELAWFLGTLGIGGLWFSFLYVRSLRWIIIGRGCLLAASLVVLIGEAIHATSTQFVKPSSASSGFLDQALDQWRQWADYTFLFAKNLSHAVADAMGLVSRLALRFTIEETIPSLLAILGAWSTMWTSRILAVYLQGAAESALYLAVSITLTMLTMYTFAYLLSVSSLSDPEAAWPPLVKSLSPYWDGVVADVEKLLFHLSLVIPLTIALLYLIHIIARYLHYDTSFPGIGVYSIGFGSLFLIALVRGFWRNRVRIGTNT